MTKESRRASRLREIFPAAGDIYAVTDCEWMQVAAEYYGMQGVALGDASGLPPEANVVLFLRNSLVSPEVRRLFPKASVLVIPIASFDPSLEAALYTQKLVMLTDYVAACEQGRYWVDRIKNETGQLAFFSLGGEVAATSVERTDLVCSFADDLSAAAWLEPAIRPGQWVSVGSFCEISFSTPPSPDAPNPFSLNGTATAAGVLVARDRHFTAAGDSRIRAAEELRRELTAAAPITLRLADGVLVEARAGGRDFTEAVREVTNPEHGLRALELGIGTNHSVLPAVSWEVNSQLNEGAGPFHLGFGEGVSGAHMDFIVAGSGHEFLSQTPDDSGAARHARDANSRERR
jgi:hypothetical protein